MKRKNYRKEFNQLKKTDKIEKEMYCTIQSILPVKKISLSGVFQIGEDLYSQTYFLEDANFSIKTFEEQAYFLQDWCNLQSSIDTRFKITVFNKNRDMRLFSERVFYKTEQDSLKKLEKAYNELIQSAIMKCRQGIEAVLYLTVTVQRKSMQSAKESFAVLQSELERQFQTMGSRIELLDAAERLDVFNDFYHMFQPERKVDLEACIASGRDWRNEIFGEEIRVKNDHLLFGDAYVKSFYFDPTDFPTDISDRFFKMLSGISCRSLITIDYVPIPKDTAINMLKQKSSGIEQEIARQQEKRNANGQFTNDITLDVRMKKKNLEAKYDKVSGSDLTTFWTGFTVVLVEQDEKALGLAQERLEQICNEFRIVCVEHHDDAQLEALNTALPVGCIQVNRMRTLFGSEAGIFIPFNVKECQMTKRPLFYGINKESKQPILLNRKELTNGNGFVLAPPGFGKSFNGAKFEIGGVLMNETDDVIIFDPANEYIDVVNAYGGAVLAFSDTSNNCINPFDFDEERLRSGDMDSRELNRIIKDKAQMMFAICQGILKELFNIHHKNIIDRSVRILYHAIAEMKPEEMRMPIMSDFYDVIRLQEGNEARDLAESLEMFVDGSLNMFNHPTNIDVHNRITTFSVRDIDEELWLPAMAIIFDFTTKRLVSNFEKGIATRLYTDEFHIFADDEYTCKYLIRCWRQWRKFQGFCTGITQNIKTVLANPKLATLISNSEYLMLLHQADDDFAVMLNTFTWMTEAHRNYLMNARPGEGIIKAGNIVIPFDNRVPKDSYVYSIYSTNAVEKAEQSS